MVFCPQTESMQVVVMSPLTHEPVEQVNEGVQTGLQGWMLVVVGNPQVDWSVQVMVVFPLTHCPAVQVYEGVHIG